VGNLGSDKHTWKTPCEDESRAWSITTTSPRMHGWLTNFQKLGRGMEQTVPYNTLVGMDLLTPFSNF
jgi:hypothetical protein